MHEVVGINYETGNRTFYFSTNKLDIKKGDELVVDTERGLQFCVATTDIMMIPDSKVVAPLKPVLRKATKEDRRNKDENRKNSKEALEKARKVAEELDLNMKFIDCSFTLDRNQLVFNFLADERVDFRELAKKLAAQYKTRIELRQVGVRDKAKEIGGIGPCGRILCCNTFLNDFNSVSINMAKNQNISLNPTKINGLCGRLLCCLTYEDEEYTRCQFGMPSVGQTIKSEYGLGKVVSVDVLKRRYKIDVDGVIREIVLDNDDSKK
jgi:cell fate regulator YaaT (PSP1 superfamily)